MRASRSVALAALLVACGGSPAPVAEPEAPPPAPEPTTLEVAEQWIAEPAPSLDAPGVVRREHADRLDGATALRRDPIVVLVSGERAAVLARHTLEVGGETVTATELDLFEVSGGRITRHETYRDRFNPSGQLGKHNEQHRPVDEGVVASRGSASSTGGALEGANIETVRQHIAAVSTRRAPRIAASYAANAILSNRAGAYDVVGADAIRIEYNLYFRAFPDLQMQGPVLWAAGEWVVATFALTGTRGKEPFRVEAASLYRIRAGKIVEHWIIADGEAMRN